MFDVCACTGHQFAVSSGQIEEGPLGFGSTHATVIPFFLRRMTASNRIDELEEFFMASCA